MFSLFRQPRIRNPGCKHCVYYLSAYYSARSGGACIHKARKKQYLGAQGYRTLFIDCDVPNMKNRRRLCNDFRMAFFIGTLLQKIGLLKGRFDVLKIERALFVGEEWRNYGKSNGIFDLSNEEKTLDDVEDKLKPHKQSIYPETSNLNGVHLN